LIKAARCILPISDNADFPSRFGLRHRSAAGITESTQAIAIIVSEETGKISLSKKGEIYLQP
jgi:diadenylate cyclase